MRASGIRVLTVAVLILTARLFCCLSLPENVVDSRVRETMSMSHYHHAALAYNAMHKLGHRSPRAAKFITPPIGFIAVLPESKTTTYHSSYTAVSESQVFSDGPSWLLYRKLII